MAVNDTDIEKESGSGWEKFLMISIPIVFTVVLLGVLLTLFNVDVRNNALELAKKIPVVKNWVPDPVLDPEKEQLEKSEKQVESAEATIEKLKSQVTAKEAELKAAKDAASAETQKTAELQKKLDDANKAAETVATAQPESESDYQKQIKSLAKMYADMSPSKAAPILQNMTNEEMVLMLNAMQSTARTKVLEKMDPKTAADVSMLMKDAKPSGDLALDALQSRLKKETAAASTTTSNSKNLDKNQLSQTFASMSASSGAKLLLETYKISPDKTLTILNSVNDATRSQLLENMSKEDSVATAKVLNRLMGNK
ncbi:MotE family protein [Paenibacillus sp. 2TAF8]|uniref:MotE family protein n=1 Tax=Paenibacillus sp. 2TAF8 TaxID=3233020 RepID=UPI003F9BBDFB